MREGKYIREKYKAILSYTGVVLAISGIVMFLCPFLSMLWELPSLAQLVAFLIPACCLFLTGLGLRRLFIVTGTEALSTREGGIIVLLSWVIVPLVSSVPFMLINDLSFTQSVFEAVSGWTTTGLSVVDVEHTPAVILLWRSLMQYAGGAGFAIMMLAALTGPVGAGYSSAEGRAEQLVPHVRQSAKLVAGIYLSYAVAGIVAYIAVGLSVFDAVNHALAAVSTGGFSTRSASIGYWNSVAVEAVTLPLMVLGSLSFITAWLLIQGKRKYALRNGEVRLMAFLIPVCTVSLFLLTTRTMYPALGKSLRVALFETVTALTTTGFSTVLYAQWNSFGICVLILLMLIGGGTCSTAGGIKQNRVYLLLRSLTWELKRSMHPATAVIEDAIWEGDQKKYVDNNRVKQTAQFVFLYMMVFILGSLILCAHGFSLQDSLFEFASALGTVGLSVGVTSPDAPDAVLWTETVAMLLGRLEFFVVFAAIVKLAMDIKKMKR